MYASPRLFAALHVMTTSLPPLPGYDRKFAVALASLGKRFAKIDAPAVSVTSNLPEGVLVQSVGPQSLRELLPVLGLATPDLAGNILRVSLPAYVAGLQWQASINREEAAIRGNLAKIPAAATAYFAAHADAIELEHGSQYAGAGKRMCQVQYIDMPYQPQIALRRRLR